MPPVRSCTETTTSQRPATAKSRPLPVQRPSDARSSRTVSVFRDGFAGSEQSRLTAVTVVSGAPVS